MKDLRGKVAVVTGAASGLGEALAHRFAGEGMHLVLADIDGEGLGRVGLALDEAGAEVATQQTDVSKGAQVDALADLAYERFGAVHVLCNNAGVPVVGTAWERSVADWSWAIGVNLWGVVHGVNAFVPRMLEQDTEGHIVNTASIAGLTCPPLSAPYVATKHAVVGLSECLHHDLALRHSKLKVSVLCPGFVKTRIVESERVRPSNLKNPTPVEDSFAQEVAEFYTQAVAEGIDPAEVASRVLDALAEQRFWVFTHDEHKELMRKRFEDIVEGRNPPTKSLAEVTRG